MEKGYLSEVFLSIQGEGGSVKGSVFGRIQIFVRFAGCNLVKDGGGCIWCDTESAKDFFPENFYVQVSPWRSDRIACRNPVSPKDVKKIIENLTLPGLHSVSITGGEPLAQPGFLDSLVQSIASDYKIYLETNATLPENARKLKSYIDYVCADIKDRTAQIEADVWEKLVEKEIETISIFKKRNSSIFAKIVVTSDTSTDDIIYIGEKIKKYNVPVVLQYSTGYKTPENTQIIRLMNILSEIIGNDNVGVSFQAHKFYSIP